MRPFARVAVVAMVVVGAAAAVGVWLGDDEGRQVGLPPPGETVATLLDDGTPVFVARHDDESVEVFDARTPARGRDGDSVALPDLLDGLVAWCDDAGFVDDLDPVATYAADGRATGATRDGLGVHDILTRERGHVLVGDAWPADRADGRGDDCEPDEAEHHGHVMRRADLEAVPVGSSWVVEAAIDLAAGVACDPPDDPLAWPLCPHGGVPVEVPDRRPRADLAADHGAAYAQRQAFGFVGRFLVTREDEDGPLTQVWRLPGEVELRAEPLHLEVDARLALRDEFRPGYRWVIPAPVPGDDEPLTTLEVSEVDGGHVPRTVGVMPSTTVTIDDERFDGEEAVAQLRAALDAQESRRWRLIVRRDPLEVPARLEHVEPLDG